MPYAPALEGLLLGARSSTNQVQFAITWDAPLFVGATYRVSRNRGPRPPSRNHKTRTASSRVDTRN